MSLHSYLEDFLNYLENEKRLSPYTLKNYGYYLNKYLEESDGEEITLELVNGFRDRISGFKKSTQNYFLIALRSFLTYLREVKNKDTLDPGDITLSRQSRQRIEPLSEDTLQSLLSAPNLNEIDGYRDRAILYLSANTGLKISELSDLNIDSIDFKSSVLRIEGKNKREIPLYSETLQILESYLLSRKDSFRPLFIRFKGVIDAQDGGEKMRLSERSIERMIKKYCSSLGLREGITPQLLRHNYGFRLASRGEKSRSIQRNLGLSSKASVKIYI